MMAIGQLQIRVAVLRVFSINSINFIHSVPFICRSQITPGQSQPKARYSAVKRFEFMSIGLAACKFNR